MAIPPYPVILTQADWNKKKGLFAKAAGETGLGALMTECERQYKAVAWTKLDVRKALAGGATGAQAQEGYMEAYNEFTKKVKPLATKVTELQTKAGVTETKFRNTKTIPSSSTAHVTKVKEAAKLFSAQLLTVKAELDAFQTAAAHPTVEDSVGTDWFLKLNRIKFYTNARVLAWTSNAELPISAEDGKVNSELKQIQTDAKAELAVFKDRVAKLNALKTKRLEKKAGIKQAATLWREASDAFLVMKPGIQGIVRSWAVTQNNLVGRDGRAKIETWERQHANAMALHKEVERILHQEEVLINPLDEHIDEIAR
jgi:hypothetical protein